MMGRAWVFTIALVLGGCCGGSCGGQGVDAPVGSSGVVPGAGPQGQGDPRADRGGDVGQGDAGARGDVDRDAGRGAGGGEGAGVPIDLADSSAGQGVAGEAPSGGDGAAEEGEGAAEEGQSGLNMSGGGRVVANYTARLSPQDHAHSRGQALESAAEVLLQDRINFHGQRHRDPEDSTDGIFQGKREQAELLAMASAFFADKESWERRVVGGKPLIRVVVFETPLGARRLRVDYLRP